jgi:Ca2+-binding EF-hand superfamily protein
MAPPPPPPNNNAPSSDGGGATPEQLRAWFDAIDRNRNGALAAVELQNALQLGGLNFSLATVAHIIRIHDRTGKGAIAFPDFSRLHEFLTNVQHSFEYFDKDKSGSLSYDEIFAALQHAGYTLERQALQAVFQRFDPARSGALGLAEFLALTLFLRSATATFNAFDPQRTGVVRLSFNQFLYAASHTV